MRKWAALILSIILICNPLGATMADAEDAVPEFV